MTDIDALIAKAHSAAEAAEDEARQIEARIARIPGAARCLPTRRYGNPISAADICKNLTLASLLQRHDPALAAFLGCSGGDHRRREEEAAARKMAADAMAAKTAELRAQNHAAAVHRERSALAGVSSLTGRRL
jgi:hypothetical protein